MSRTRNPSRRAALEEAGQRLQEYSGHESSEVIKANIDIKPGFVLGPMRGVLYDATRDGKLEKYIHKFKGDAAPTLAATHDGKQLMIVGGRYEVTDAGIEDM